MRKLFLVAIVAAALLVDNGVAQALGHRGGGCGGCDSGCGRARHHRGGHRHHGGCGGCGGCAAAPAPCGAPACCDAGGCGTAYALADEDGPAPATMIVELPEDATLTIDGVQTTSTSSTRVLVTPALETGRTFNYTLTAQVMRDGVPQTVTQQVTVRAGQETHVSMTLPVAVVSR